MSLNIENDEIRRLAMELANLTGETAASPGKAFDAEERYHRQRVNPALAMCLSEVRDEKAKCDCL